MVHRYFIIMVESTMTFALKGHSVQEVVTDGTCVNGTQQISNTMVFVHIDPLFETQYGESISLLVFRGVLRGATPNTTKTG